MKSINYSGFKMGQKVVVDGVVNAVILRAWIARGLYDVTLADGRTVNNIPPSAIRAVKGGR